MNNNFIPPQYSGNLVRIDEAEHNGALVSPPAGRWRAIHNTSGANITIKAPGNEVYAYLTEDEVARSTVHAPGNLGKLDEDTALADFDGAVTAVDAGTTADFTGDTSGVVTVTRNGEANPSGVGAPSFNGINWTSSALVTLVVNAEGSGLKEGDVITFPLTTNDDISITFVVGQNDLQLSLGFYQTVASTAVTLLTLADKESAFLNVSSFEVDSTGNNAVITAFFG